MLDCNILAPIGDRICEKLGLPRNKYYASWMDINYYVMMHNYMAKTSEDKIKVDWKTYTKDTHDHTSIQTVNPNFTLQKIYRHPVVPLSMHHERDRERFVNVPRMYDISLYTGAYEKKE